MNENFKKKKIELFSKYMDEMEIEAMLKAMDEVYNAYEADHAFKSTMYLHPMFYNETYCENNCYQPEEPQKLMTIDEFFENSDIRKEWDRPISILYYYILKELMDKEK